MQLVACERTDPAIVVAALGYCEHRGDCLYVGSVPQASVSGGTAISYGQALQGAKVYESEGPFGKTERFFAAVDGEAADLPKVRDDAAQQLEGVGFKSLSTDEEENTEAEAHLQGDKHTVDIQVIALCTGKLRIRYTVS